MLQSTLIILFAKCDSARNAIQLVKFNFKFYKFCVAKCHPKKKHKVMIVLILQSKQKSSCCLPEHISQPADTVSGFSGTSETRIEWGLWRKQHRFFFVFVNKEKSLFLPKRSVFKKKEGVTWKISMFATCCCRITSGKCLIFEKTQIQLCPMFPQFFGQKCFFLIPIGIFLARFSKKLDFPSNEFFFSN